MAMLTTLDFKMIIAVLVALFMGAGLADIVPHKLEALVFYDNDTLLAPNSHGEMVTYTIVDPTWELSIPGAPDKIKVAGTADRVIDYINNNFPDYVWPHVDNVNTTSSDKAPQDDPKPNCNVFEYAPYDLVKICYIDLQRLGNHFFNLGSGPRTCAEVQCREHITGRRASIWWCNDDATGAAVTANDIAEMAWYIIPDCTDYAVPLSYTRGQVFHATEPWNVIINGGEKCR